MIILEGSFVLWYIALVFLTLLLHQVWRLRLKSRPVGSLNNLFHDSATDSPLVIAHRGASLEAPENTLAAFKNARENGALAVEFDVDFTKDGVAVIMHDATVDRTTDGQGKVGEYTLENIRKLDASSKHRLRDKFPSERVPTLAETVETCIDLGLQMMIEIKAGSDAKKTAEVLIQLFTKYNLYNKAAVTSYFPGVLYQVRKADPRISTGLVWWKEAGSSILLGEEKVEKGTSVLSWTLGPILDSVWTNSLPLVFNWLGISYFIADHDHVCRRLVQDWKARGVSVCVYTVNQPYGGYFNQSLNCPVITDTVLAYLESTSLGSVLKSDN